MIVSEPNPFQALAALGAGDFAHLNGSLERHFTSVHALLEQWGADETLCRAGLFHAVYGTAGFTAAMVSLDQRSKIADIIGADAEQIAYRYCSCDRSIVWPQIGGSSPVIFRDRFTDEQSDIDASDLSLFCELTCANEIEIAQDDPDFIERAGAYLRGLFDSWHPFLSEPAREAVARIFPL